MVWTFVLWFMFGAVLPSSNVFGNEDNFDDWPYVIKKQDFPEQSPVDIPTKLAKKHYLPFIRSFGYQYFDKTIVEVFNTGHTVCVQFTKDSKSVPFITGGPLFDSMYEFNQMHFHWGKNDSGSEHKVDGYSYAMEVHIVHYKKEYGSFENAQNYADGVCVISFFGEISSMDNLEMDDFIEDLKYITDMNTTITRSFRDEFAWIRKTVFREHYFTYHGSLTTEPFTECVIWIIFTNPFEISRRQITEFRKLHSSHNSELIKENDREIQPFNNRAIVHGY